MFASDFPIGSGFEQCTEGIDIFVSEEVSLEEEIGCSKVVILDCEGMFSPQRLSSFEEE